MVCTICFLAWRKILNWGRWQFELVQFFLKVGWSLFCYAHMVYTCMVCTVWIVFLMHAWSILASSFWNIDRHTWCALSVLFYDSWLIGWFLSLHNASANHIRDFFLKHSWCVLSVFLCDGNSCLWRKSESWAYEIFLKN